MANKYVPVSQYPSEDPFSKEVEEDQPDFRLKKSRASIYLAGLLVLSLITNLITLGLWQGVFKRTTLPSKYAKSKEISTVFKHFWWNTEYSSTNYSHQDALWDAILPSHGFVAMDREWAASQNWPESMRLPQDESKGVYLLEAYHQLHCLRILRKTMGEALTGKPFTWKPGAHIEHCFDTLRQAAMCNADSTPLYTFGDNTAGDGQLHQCRDWNALRDYATEHKACYRDTIEDVLLGQHFGYCDDGDDGLIEALPVGMSAELLD